MRYSDRQRVEKICSTATKLLAYLKDANISLKDVLDEETVQWTLTTPLYNIGEHAYYLSDDFKIQHPDIPWAKISGLRHRLVHNYDDTNWNVIGTVLFEILPEFQKSVSDLLEDMQKD